jgi:hypothetical protein
MSYDRFNISFPIIMSNLRKYQEIGGYALVIKRIIIQMYTVTDVAKIYMALIQRRSILKKSSTHWN